MEELKEQGLKNPKFVPVVLRVKKLKGFESYKYLKQHGLNDAEKEVTTLGYNYVVEKISTYTIKTFNTTKKQVNTPNGTVKVDQKAKSKIYLLDVRQV